jgi:hypothetical protein
MWRSSSSESHARALPPALQSPLVEEPAQGGMDGFSIARLRKL